MLRRIVLCIVLALLLPGTPARAGFLGVDVEETWTGGLRITRVTPGSPAERLGLQPGYVIVNMRGRTLSTVDDMRQLVTAVPAHRWVTLDYVDGSDLVLGWAILAEDSSEAAMAAVPFLVIGKAGFTVADSSDGAAGVLVGSVDPQSPAAYVGVLAGDRITSLDRRPVSRSIEFVEIVYNAPGTTMPMTIDRYGSIIELNVTIEAHDVLSLRPNRVPMPVASSGSDWGTESDPGPDCGPGTARLCDPDPVPQPAPTGPRFCGSAPDGTPIYC